MKLIRCPETQPCPEDVRKLYVQAFPRRERIPVSALIRSGGTYRFEDENGFAGFVSVLTWKDISHITYFAVAPALRGRGYGSSILTLMADELPGQRIIVDVEQAEEGAPNPEERKKRIRFYERNGYKKTEIAYRWRGEDYIIMSRGGDVSEEEFDSFWDHVLS